VRQACAVEDDRSTAIGVSGRTARGALCRSEIARAFYPVVHDQCGQAVSRAWTAGRSNVDNSALTVDSSEGTVDAAEINMWYLEVEADHNI